MHFALTNVFSKPDYSPANMSLRALNTMSRAAVPRSIRARATHTVQLPDLPYEYGALEPKISGTIMELHHSKHHNTYVAGFNTAQKELVQATQAADAKKIISLQSAINFHGGGAYIFVTDYEPPQGDLAKAIESQFGGLDQLKTKTNAAAAALQGSGWAWLGLNPATKGLVIATSPNQDILDKQGLVPLLGIDMWEHAYYLQYKNVKPDYLNAIWDVINWREVAQRYENARK